MMETFPVQALVAELGMEALSVGSFRLSPSDNSSVPNCNFARSQRRVQRALVSRAEMDKPSTVRLSTAPLLPRPQRGGTVLLPAGAYLSLSIHLKSNIRLHLDQGAVLLAAPLTETLLLAYYLQSSCLLPPKSKSPPKETARRGAEPAGGPFKFDFQEPPSSASFKSQFER